MRSTLINLLASGVVLDVQLERAHGYDGCIECITGGAYE